ncbi:MAG: hypothetical protein N3E47_00535 [Candidatus Bathyarchaeota archaeon]|nr:hypothetical protein [Candidatus Bathyarchaeota archaeon]
MGGEERAAARAISVWGISETQVNKITFDIIKMLPRKEEADLIKGMITKPTRGFSIPADETPKGVYGKIVECLLEIYLRVEIPASKN